MFETKTILAVSAVILTFVGYVPYIADIFKGKTKPHAYSWLIWGTLTGIIFALQVSAGAGVGSVVTLFLTLISFFVFIQSLKRGTANITNVDKVFLVLALCALPLWLVINQPVLSIILLMTIDLLGFVPTVRKTWQDPYTETLSMYVITTFRHMISFLALAEYNIVTWLFSVSGIIVNILFSFMLIYRRRK